MDSYIPKQIIETECTTRFVHANECNDVVIVKGDRGVTFKPFVDEESNLSWTNDGGLPNPETVNIRGKDAEMLLETITNSEIDEILRG